METTCTKLVDRRKFCADCHKNYVKNGRSSSGIQRYKCKTCGKNYQQAYLYKSYKQSTNNRIVRLLKEGCGLLSIARLLHISTTVQRRILRIAKSIRKPIIPIGKTYEMDELCTYARSKKNRIWIAYALCKESKAVVDFRVGKRTNRTLRPIIQTLQLARATKIFTDKLSHYKSLIRKEIHQTKRRGTNHIERMNLTLRTHLKRLNRRTINYTKSVEMLAASLKIYFWHPSRKV